eukprot:CAMPEP_0119339666 /NCGR_PEP_ID=MMETSP1333-20130426/98769_1 /TAXON_ID=418940 /ORGANISM="Scyphosphaera apsteinii, Strain RCC1455" /LENGTH=63 /DNA_ID=CAMNT_0007351241 /DNA_START=434 /DNA_END=625 /DNA_ORIENTATION=+
MIAFVIRVEGGSNREAILLSNNTTDGKAEPPSLQLHDAPSGLRLSASLMTPASSAVGIMSMSA